MPFLTERIRRRELAFLKNTHSISKHDVKVIMVFMSSLFRNFFEKIFSTSHYLKED